MDRELLLDHVKFSLGPSKKANVLLHDRINHHFCGLWVQTEGLRCLVIYLGRPWDRPLEFHRHGASWEYVAPLLGHIHIMCIGCVYLNNSPKCPRKTGWVIHSMILGNLSRICPNPGALMISSKDQVIAGIYPHQNT